MLAYFKYARFVRRHETLKIGSELLAKLTMDDRKFLGSKRSYLLGISLLLMASFATPANAEWLYHDFEVFVGDPHPHGSAAESVNDIGLDTLGEHFDQQFHEEIAKMEHFLHDVAVEYDRMGFPDPVAAGALGKVNEDWIGDGGAIRVYLLDISKFNTALSAQSRLAAAYLGRCDAGLPDWASRIILINRPRAFSNGRITDGAYNSMAHELFHAIQAASRMGDGIDFCKTGKWIKEGTADAIGHDMGRKLRGLTYAESHVNPSFLKIWGGRRYHTPLADADRSQSDDYFTSSFWRHLAEWNVKGQHSGSAEASFDYRYLASLIDTPIDGTDDAAELRWLDSWMRSQTNFRVGLAQIYAQFTSSFADIITSRIPQIRGLTPESSREPRWLNRLFEECPEVTLSRGRPKDEVTLKIEPNAARCVTLRVAEDTYTPYQIVIDNGDLDRAKQKQLHVGYTGEQLVSRGDVRIVQAPSVDVGRSFVKWQFLAYPQIPNRFIISNMSSDPGSTEEIEAEFNFSIPTWKSTMTTEPPPQSVERSEGAPKSRAAVKNYMEGIRTSPTMQSSGAVMSARELAPRAITCSDEYLLLNLCGPQLSISLTKDYGFFPQESPVASTGGLLEQMGSLQMQSEQEELFLEQLQGLAQDNTGNAINISIPLIEYGFEDGNIFNARIEVSGRLENGIVDTYSSISAEPETLMSGGKVYPPNGRVVIKEYTPHILRGTFQATLVSNEAAKKARVSASNPVLPTMGTINGSFSVSAPWRGSGVKPDTRVNSSLMTGIQNDMMNILLKLPEDMRFAVGANRLGDLCKIGFDDQQLEALGIGGSCGRFAGATSSSASCDCNCNNWELIQSTMPACSASCDQKWRLWSCGPYLETGLSELDAETQRYQAEAEQVGVPENVWQSWVLVFRDSPPDLRPGLWDELERFRSQQAELDRPEELVTIQAEQRERDERRSQYDEETQRYKVALEAAGYRASEVAGLVEIFAPSPAGVRRVYWDTIANRQ